MQSLPLEKRRKPEEEEGASAMVVILGRRRRHGPVSSTTTTLGHGFDLLRLFPFVLCGLLLLGGGISSTGGGGAVASFAPSPRPILPFSHLNNGAIPFGVVVRSIQTPGTARRAKWGNSYTDEDDNDCDDEYGGRLRPTTSFGGSESVPENQRPVNEYLDLLRQPLFDWATETSKLIARCGALYATTFGAISYPIAGATFANDDSDPDLVWPRLAAANVGSVALLLLLLLRLLVGWQYVADRLTSVRVEYEETGWFDGSVQLKTLTEQKRDKFLFQSNVQPIVKRLNGFAMGAALTLLVSIGVYQFALQHHPPRFDQYDPAMLERLKYDPDLAGKAAEAAGVRPAYCDSRYYRAVAGGAPGCQ